MIRCYQSNRFGRVMRRGDAPKSEVPLLSQFEKTWGKIAHSDYLNPL
jgi:hypothetical protein